MKDDAVLVDEDRFWKMKPKVFFTALGIAVVAATSWGMIKHDVSDVSKEVTAHGAALESISTQLTEIKTDARQAREATAAIAATQREAELKHQYTQELINQKLDFLTGDKRGPRPASGP